MLHASTPVLVLNAVHYGALGLNRSLGRLGVPVYNVVPKRAVPAFFSRYSRGSFVCDINAAGAEASVDLLISIGKKLPGKALLVATCDVTAALVADYDKVLRERFLFPRQRADLVHLFCSKKGLYELAQANGVPTPATRFPECRDDMLRFVEAARFPIVLKTVQNRIGERQLHGIKIIARTRQDLIRHYDRLENPEEPNLMLQEYIPGDEDTNCMFNGYFDSNSDCLIGLTGQKLRQYPAYAGVTSLGVCRRNEVVATMAKKFMKAVGYRGALDCGFRFDVRDGQYKVYDVNPRIGATFRLFVDSTGLDVARALYMDMTGQPVQAGELVQGRKWIVEDSDLASSTRYVVDRKLGVKSWASSLRGIEEGAIFAKDDIWPITGRICQHVSGGCRSVVKLLSRRLSVGPGVSAVDQPTENA